MPFIRYSRDKRGYESMVVMHAYRPGDGPQRARVLYMFRSPANLKVGRKALEPEVIEALEHTHPDLSFDWTAIRREPKPTEARPRQGRERGGGRRQGRGGDRPPAPPPEVIDDQTTLGRALGAAEAARLRTAYQELLQRISRRARTPEDRDRLLERAARLNPDEWPDEAAVRSQAPQAEAGWADIATELPRRRRGRRGGRRRDEAGPAGPSGIMAEGADTDGEPTDDTPAGADRAADPGDRAGDDGVAADGGDETEPPGSADVPDER